MKNEYARALWIKRFLPASLFGRALLILVLPMLIMQAGALYFFYAQHWVNVERHLSLSLTGDVAFIDQEMLRADDRHRRDVEQLAIKYLDMDVRREPLGPDASHFTSNSDDEVFSSFVRSLRETIPEPFSITRTSNGGENRVALRIRHKDNVLRLQFSIKRLSNVTTEIFVWWMLGSAAVLLFIATSFLRNQIRPITKLAEAAENFGRGLESTVFRPQGASEVRAAGRSFIAMRERLKRMINARTDMLAAISHDLRTPLTRMRLALAMLSEQKYARPLIADVLDMEKMIQEYLDFARGEGGEQPRTIRFSSLLMDVVGRYTRQGSDVTLTLLIDPELSVYYNAMRRCLYNVIDNALRYGTTCQVIVQGAGKGVELFIDDNGPGIPPDQRELAKQPFKRLDASRNSETGGAGLGLSIVQDIVLRHGGSMALEDSPLGGLRVRIRLPA